MKNLSTSSWAILPNELRVAVIEGLSLVDAKQMSLVDSNTRELCVPSVFQAIRLKDSTALRRYLIEVPSTFHRYIRSLEVQTTPVVNGSATKMVQQLLASCVLLESLELKIGNGLGHQVLECFGHLDKLRRLTVANSGDETTAPLSERLVVSIALSIPHLEHLQLDRVARSALHAPELVGAYPPVPLVANDATIPPHPTLNTALSLPSLLTIPTLRTLRIRDTHLGDPLWSTVPIACTALSVIDLSGCPFQTARFNQLCTERILAQVGASLEQFSLHTGLSKDTTTAAPLKRLRHVHLTPLFPVDDVVQTLSSLSGSPIERLSVQCYADDAVDMCSALEDFLSTRAETGAYPKLSGIDVNFNGGQEDKLAFVDNLVDEEEQDARDAAAKRLLEYCEDLQVTGCIGKLTGGPLTEALQQSAKSITLMSDALPKANLIQVKCF